AALLLASLAAIRWLYRAATSLLLFLALIAAIAACLQYVTEIEAPFFGKYLSRVPIEASITLLGILLATIGAMRAWRLQKRDEILLQSLAEIQAFFEQVSNAAGELNAYLALL